jgi:membrane carboxypeptidase/penicillin-binding protein PbpC
LLWDVPTSSTTIISDVENPDGTFHGPVRLRTALVNDYVIPAVQMLTQMGSENVLRLLRQVGIDTSEITSDLSTYPFYLMEDSKVTLLDLTQAYGVIANNGISAGQVLSTDSATNGNSAIKPVSILQVKDSLGGLWMKCQDELYNCQTQTKPVISAQLAYLMTHILSDETARWSSMGHPNPLEIGRPAAAKIGQTFQKTDAWTIGYTPDLVVGVWMGSNKDELQNFVPTNGAAGIWHAIIQYATQDKPLTEWPLPAGISEIKVCDPSGMLPTYDCPVVVTEVFQNGREPTQEDTLFRSLQINRESGRLATVFTPPELVETRVFMVVPPEASAWASQAGLLTPPESYDVLDPLNNQSESVNIKFPEMFANVNGQVIITGNADDDKFANYRVQIGEGLNPSSWLQISKDKNTPVSNGELAVWDTTGLDGLYALQLLVVNQDQNVKIFTTQITIDNQPPEISIRYPEDGQAFTFPKDSRITFEVDANDNLELTTVVFYLNDIMLSSLKTPPYAVPWETRIGKHTLRVLAIDLAGNTSEEIIKFEVTR